ncbi:uncharacterized protein [Bemisia tabaci]|uniref:uncharacterized protein isoform X2 n=1 Tax=Bemisia tabaci TaxID=7038 RepID=UPI003B281589
MNSVRDTQHTQWEQFWSCTFGTLYNTQKMRPSSFTMLSSFFVTFFRFSVPSWQILTSVNSRLSFTCLQFTQWVT